MRLQPSSTGYTVTVGRRSLLVDAARTQLMVACGTGVAELEEVVQRVAAQTGEPAAKLQMTMRSLLSMGVLVPVSAGAESPDLPARNTFRALPEAEIAPGPALDAGAALRFRRQTLLRPSPEGFQVWSAPLHARVTLGPDTLRALPHFAPPGQVISRALAALSPDAGRQAELLTAVSRLVAAGVLVPATLAQAVAPAAQPGAPAPKPRLLYARDASQGRTPVYCVNAGQPGYPPLALGLMVAHAKEYRGGALKDRYDFVEDWLDSAEAVEEAQRLHGTGIFLFSSYVWCERQVLEISKQVKERDPGSLVILGGPSAPKYEAACEQYFTTHRQIDVLVRGEGEITFAELLDKVRPPLAAVNADGQLAGVTGLTYRASGGKVVRTPDRDRVKDLTQFPSPYLTGIFENLAAHDGGSHLKSMILETNRGCPYGCTFCDWGSATLQKINKFPMERVYAELDWAGRHQIVQVWCADANFGIFDRDVEIAEAIVRTREKYGFPTQMTVNYAKNATERHAEIMRIFGQGGIHSEAILAVQSTSEETLKTIRRQNIKTERYDQLAGIFRSEGLEFASDLMIGLPGDTVDSFKGSLQHFFDRDVWVQCWQTILLPNSPMADPEYLKENKIVTAGSVVVGSYSYNIEELGVMTRLASYYQLTVNLALLKYLLYFLQYDHGMRASDVLHGMIKHFELGDGHAKYPLMSWILGRYRMELEKGNPDRIIGMLDAPSSWDEFLAEVREYLTAELGVPADSALDAALAVQRAILPTEAQEYPLTVELKHDFARYMEDRRAARAGGGAKRLLVDYPPGRFTVADPTNLARTARPELLERDHIVRFELESPLRPKNVELRRSANSPGLLDPAALPPAAGAPAASARV